MNRILSVLLTALWAYTSVVTCPSTIGRQAHEAVPSPPESIKQTPPIDLAEIGHIASKGRVQDQEYNRLEVVERLIAGGKQSIPFLIGQLESERIVKARVLDYWNKVTVGDLAFIILMDFFLDSTRHKSTIAGLTWNEFLEVEKDSHPAAEEQLRAYITKHGRRQIKVKWQRIWEQNQKRLHWDEKDRCFKPEQ
jgi:hypothetical protein